MKTIAVIVLFVAMSLAPKASAELFYQYVDSHGNMIYTDDLNKVPVEQRNNAKRYENTSLAAKSESKAAPVVKSEIQKQNASKLALQAQRYQLAKFRTELKEEFQSLSDENAKLKNQQAKAVTPDKIRAFNKQVVSFNQRFKAYQEKDAAYQSQLETYNNQVEAMKAKPGN